MAAARELYGSSYECMVLVLNASANRGIDVVREKIHKFVSTDTVFYNQLYAERKKTDVKKLCKLVILDETDAMTSDAQDSLRVIMEKYIDNARFCLICNYIAQIRDAIQSRCTKLKFTPIKNEDMKNKIIEVCKNEDIKISKDGIETLITRADGDMRFILNSLQSIPKIDGILTSSVINENLGYPTDDQIDEIYEIIKKYTLKNAVSSIRIIVRKYGLSTSDLLTEIHDKLLKDETIKLSTKYIIFDQLANIEVYQSGNTNEKIQLVGLISCFKNVSLKG
jgi:replication factor C subunit 3/5